MSYTTYKSSRFKAGPRQHNNPIVPHGGYRKLKSYQMTELIYDLTIEFCRLHIDRVNNKSYQSYKQSLSLRDRPYSRQADQMIQAARSGKQNIAEGCMVSGTSKKTELKLINVARASLEELLQDFEDFLRQRGLPIWDKNDPRAKRIRALAYGSDKSYKSYMTYLNEPEAGANTMICLIHQANYLLDQQLRALERDFLEKGGFTERLYKSRQQNREISHR